MNGINFAKLLILMGTGIVVIGLIILFFIKIGLPFGKLPGDIHIKNEKFAIYFPMVTSIVISVLLTIVINFIIWLFKK